MSELTPPGRRAYRDYLPEGQRGEPEPAAEPDEPRPGHGTMFLRFELFPGSGYASWQDQDRHADLLGTPDQVIAWAFSCRAGNVLAMAGEEYREVGICLPASAEEGKAALRAIGVEL